MTFLSWDAIHPLIVYFAIVSLLVSPLFVLSAAIVSPSRNKPYMLVGLVALLVGTISLFVAALSGEAAARLHTRADTMEALLRTHETLATHAEIVFSFLTFALAGIFFWPWISLQASTRLSSTLAPILFLTAYTVGIAYLLSTAHDGRAFAHESGAHKSMTSLSDSPMKTPRPDTLTDKQWLRIVVQGDANTAVSRYGAGPHLR